jgi:hypothetical protein
VKPEDHWDPELKEKIKEAYYGEYDIDKSRDAAIRRLPSNHAWRKVGPYAICFSCSAQHSNWIGPLKKLEKDKEGNFVVTDIVLQ